MQNKSGGLVEVAGTYMNMCPVGTKIWFLEEKQGYTVRASNRFYSVCTKPFNAKKTVIYTVIDWRERIRGTENLIFGIGAKSDEDCRDMLDRLTTAKSDVSSRNWCQLHIIKAKFPKHD